MRNIRTLPARFVFVAPAWIGQISEIENGASAVIAVALRLTPFFIALILVVFCFRRRAPFVKDALAIVAQFKPNGAADLVPWPISAIGIDRRERGDDQVSIGWIGIVGQEF